MNIYLVTLDYFARDAYKGHVVLALNEEAAINACIWGDADWVVTENKIIPKVTFLGIASEEAIETVKNTLILSSFNAG